EPSKQQEISELQEQIKQLQMEVDVLKEALNLLKKDPGINITELKNREKAVIIGHFWAEYFFKLALNLSKITTVDKRYIKHDIIFLKPPI
ncbi:hypothetical protein DXA10_06530, partial [Firmicutes bacterium AM55-24TS]